MARKAPFGDRTARHLRILSGRTRRTLPGTGPKHSGLFMHMPKCGGTSLSEALYATVPFSDRIGVIDAVSTRRAAAMCHFGKDDPMLCHEDLDHGQLVFDLRESMLLQHMAWDTRLIHGHVFWSQQARAHFGTSYKYVTLLRDPVARTVSNLRMAQRGGVVSSDMDSYLESPVARRQARVYLRYLTGRNDIAEDDLAEATALAKARLSEFALVGFLDRSDAFRASYRALFGVSLRLARLNAAPEQRPDYTDSQMRRLTEICAPDVALFDHARTLA